MSKDFNILVADDEESIRSIIGEVLSDDGYQVQTAQNGKEALEVVEKGGIHVVVTDIRMPEMTGIELLEKVKEFDENIEAIIMTSHASIETAIKAIRLGAYDYLTKPFDDLNIIPTVIDRTVGKLRLELEVKKLLAALKQRNKEIQDLYNCTTELSQTLKPDEVIDLSLRALNKLTGGVQTAYYHVDKDKKNLELTHTLPKEGKAAVEVKSAPLKAPLIQRLVDNGDVEKNLRELLAKQQDEKTTFIAPLFQRQTLYGCYVVVSSEEEINDDTRALTNQYVGNVAMQLEKATLHATVETLAIKDELTGLYNRRHLQNVLENELARAKRFKQKLSVLLFDVDHFKHYNDTNGHLEGDKLLSKMGKLLLKLGRNIDVAARYGGEEFLLILLQTDKEGAACCAEKIRKGVEEESFNFQEKQPLGNLTISGGYAEYPADADTAKDMLEAADKALYRAKEAGRNQMAPAKSKKS